MKRAALCLVFIGLIAFSIAHLFAQAPDQATHAPSGDTQVTVISIFVPPLPNAPFTATVSTTGVRKLDGGGTFTVQNRRTIARDNVGRIFEERRWLYPAGNPNENLLRQTEISDPTAHTIYYCQPNERRCEIYAYYRRATPAPLVPAGPIEEGKAFLTREILGNDSVNGVEAVGTRETTTYNAGAFGNDQPVSLVKEFWYSPQLGVNVIEKRQDPSYGTQNFVVSDISLGEPDAKLFETPANFQVMDMRKPSEAWR